MAGKHGKKPKQLKKRLIAEFSNTMAMLIVATVIIADQIVKLKIRQSLGYKESIAVIGKLMYITHSYNTGAGFSILLNQNSLLIAISTAILVTMLFYLNKLPKDYCLPLSFIIAGTVSNLIDRIMLGKVVDYIAISIFPVFNIADISITIGAIMVLFLLFRE